MPHSRRDLKPESTPADTFDMEARTRARCAACRDAGFTMIEMLVTISIAGILFALAIGGWTAYQRAQAHRGTAEDIAILFRDVHQRAVTEGRHYCVKFLTATTWDLRPDNCSATATSTYESQSTKVTVSGVPHLEFLERGSATSTATAPFQLQVCRERNAANACVGKVYTVTVVALTGRVEVSS